jgi:hypothetical protein
MEECMSRTAITCAVALAIVMVLAATRRAPADDGCSNRTLHGSYGIDASGTVASGPLAGPIALIGVLTYDGFGRVSGVITQRATTATGPTTLTRLPFAGTYTVNSDCTAEDSLVNLANGSQSVHEYAIVDGGRRFSILNTTAGPTVVLGTGIKQARSIEAVE